MSKNEAPARDETPTDIIITAKRYPYSLNGIKVVHAKKGETHTFPKYWADMIVRNGNASHVPPPKLAKGDEKDGDDQGGKGKK